jgi:hypothetical protein
MFGDAFQVHEIAETSTRTVCLVVLATTSLSEISDRGVFGYQQAAGVVAVSKCRLGNISLFFCLELDIHIAHHMIA